MSARQNKKQRKGRNNANNRERTVTTLTEDPNTPYLIPTPSEEPAGATLMSSPFSVASSSAGNPGNIPSAYQLPGSYNAFGYNNSYTGPAHGPGQGPNQLQGHHQQQPPQYYPSPQPILPPGKNDLEVLEKLKEIIKNGQHEVYRAIPQPAALASIYLGPIATSQVAHHPEQSPQAQANPNIGSGPSSPVDLGRRPPRIQNKDGWDPSNQRKPMGGAPPTNNNNQSDRLKSIDVHMSETPSTLTVSTDKERLTRFDSGPMSGNNFKSESVYGGAGNISPEKSSALDDKTRENGWSAVDDRRRDSDRPLPSPPPRTGGSDTRSNAGDRDRYFDRDRDRDRREWDRDRRPYDRFRDNVRRPPPELRHYEPDYDRPRRYDGKGPDDLPADARRRLSDARVPPPAEAPLPSDDRLTAARAPPTDLRPSPDIARPPLPDSRAPVRGPPFDEARGAPPPVSRLADAPGASRPADDREGVRAPTQPPAIPLEERISRPSLQDRLSQPPAGRPEPATHLSRQGSLEDRISHIPVSTDSRDRGARPVHTVVDRAGPADQHTGSRPTPAQDERPGRYVRGNTPVSNVDGPFDTRGRTPVPDVDGVFTSRGRTPVRSFDSLPYHTAVHPPPRSSSVVRDDPRAAKGPASPPHRPVSRDYRAPGRPLSRERPGVRGNNYRPDERNYVDDRRPDGTDLDVPPTRYNDSRVGPYRPFSPPSAADLARDRARQFPPSPADLARDRARSQFPASPPRIPVSSVDGPPYDDVDRRFPGRDWAYSQQQQQYSDRRRDWTPADEEYYKNRAIWERNGGPPPPPSDRDRFERDAPPLPMRNHGWETREERDRRDSGPRPPSPPPRSFDGPPRPLGSRLTETYSTGGLGGPDRTYPPPQPPLASFSRVRQRSLSPARRPGGLIDDLRPPMKRPRDDAYSDFYPPPPPQSRGDPGPLRRPADYPPRGGSPPPSSGGSSYFDRSGPPPSSAGTTGSGAPGGDRDYPPGREYPPGGYERQRSPGPTRGYSRGGYGGRDDRRYAPPPSTMLPPVRRP